MVEEKNRRINLDDEVSGTGSTASSEHSNLELRGQENSERRYHLRVLNSPKKESEKVKIEIISSPNSHFPKGTQILLDRSDYNFLRDEIAIHPEHDPDLREEDYLDDVINGEYVGRIRSYSPEMLNNICESVGINSGSSTEGIKVEPED